MTAKRSVWDAPCAPFLVSLNGDPGRASKLRMIYVGRQQLVQLPVDPFLRVEIDPASGPVFLLTRSAPGPRAP